MLLSALRRAADGPAMKSISRDRLKMSRRRNSGGRKDAGARNNRVLLTALVTGSVGKRASLGRLVAVATPLGGGRVAAQRESLGSLRRNGCGIGTFRLLERPALPQRVELAARHRAADCASASMRACTKSISAAKVAALMAPGLLSICGRAERRVSSSARRSWRIRSASGASLLAARGLFQPGERLPARLRCRHGGCAGHIRSKKRGRARWRPAPRKTTIVVLGRRGPAAPGSAAPRSHSPL